MKGRNLGVLCAMMLNTLLKVICIITLREFMKERSMNVQFAMQALLQSHAKFAEKRTLDNHIRTIHENSKHIDETKKAFHCNSCLASFAIIRSLKIIS